MSRGRPKETWWRTVEGEAEDYVLPLGMKLSPLREIEQIFFVNLYLYIWVVMKLI